MNELTKTKLIKEDEYENNEIKEQFLEDINIENKVDKLMK